MYTMKKILLSLALVLTATASRAQELTLQTQQPTTSDLLSMLEENGYKLLVFDLSPLAGKTYHFDLRVQEYKGGALRKEYTVLTGQTRQDFADLPAAERQRLLNDPEIIEANTARKLLFCFMPAAPDSLQRVSLGTENFKTYLNLPKRPTRMPLSGLLTYTYSISTFAPTRLITGRFIPLVLFASAHLDDGGRLINQSSTAVSTDLQDPLLLRSPHCYVLGVTFEEDSM